MKPRNRMQVMLSIFGLQPGTILSIPEIAEHLKLKYEENTTAVEAMVTHFIEQDILAEVFPNCFVTETMVGGNRFLHVYTHIIEDMYVSNIANLPHKHFEELAKDPEYKGFYADEEWPTELKTYLQNQDAKPCIRIMYGKPTPIPGSREHEFGGYVYTGSNIHVVDQEFNVSTRLLTVADLFSDNIRHYRAIFATQAEALEYASFYTNPDNALPKRRQLRNQDKVADKQMNTSNATVVPGPGDQKMFSLNDIHKMWDTVPGFDGSPYAQQLKGHFMDNVLAKFV